MRKSLLIIALFIMSGVLTAFAQDSMKPTYLSGEVVSVTSDKLVLKTKDAAVEITLQPATTYRKVPPDNPKLAAAVDAAFADIAAGDKVIVSSIIPADKKTIPARTVI